MHSLKQRKALELIHKKKTAMYHRIEEILNTMEAAATHKDVSWRQMVGSIHKSAFEFLTMFFSL
jgi:hypothetical protein